MSAALWIVCYGCEAPDAGAFDRAARAESFFRGLFACDPAAVDRYAADDVAVSYPIFETLYQTSVIRGREAVREFAAGFCSRWKDPIVSVREAVVDGDRVVLVWEFSAVPSSTTRDAADTADSRTSWGGISFFRFNTAGEVIEEVGEESVPGPAARIWGS